MRRKALRSGQIDCRIMVNYKVEMDVLRKRLPAPFRPRGIHGYGIAGFCFFKVPGEGRRNRPAYLVVHRIEAEASLGGTQVPGTYILRTDVSGRRNSRQFGDFFPKVMHTSRIDWQEETEGHYHLLMGTKGRRLLEVRAHESARFPFESVMETEEIASDFFAQGEVWFTPRYAQTLFEQRRWSFAPWNPTPLRIDGLEAPFFRSVMRFPNGSFYFDHGLIMHQLSYEVTSAVELIAPRPIRLLFDGENGP